MGVGRASFLLLASVCLGACGTQPAATVRQEVPVVSEAQAPRAVPRETRPRVVVLGDSLTAGLGLARDEAYPALLQRRLDKEGYEFEVVNAGVSGDTTAGGLRRLDWSLDGDVKVLVVALGGNDGLRGLPVDEMKRNLTDIIEGAEKRGVAVLLAGMEAPPNTGQTYTAQFRKVFRDLAAEHHLPFVPFLLQGVAGNPALNQPDGIHPTAEGARMVADLIWPALKPMLAGSSRTAGVSEVRTAR